MLADVVVAECVYVLESFYEVERQRIAELMRAAIALPSIKTVDRASLLRALEVYEVDRLDFAEAYLVAQAEATGVGTILTRAKSRDGALTYVDDAPGPLREAQDLTDDGIPFPLPVLRHRSSAARWRRREIRNPKIYGHMFAHMCRRQT